MNLGLEISPRILGQAALPLNYEVVRSLRVEDLELLNTPRGSSAPPLQRLTDRHHSTARLIAQGIPPGEVAAIMSFSPTRVSILQSDPAFKELVNFYRTDAQREARSNFERLSGLAADAADILQDRMENKPDDITTGQLVEIVKVGADRSGNGPQTSSVQVNVNVGLADRLKRAREIASAASEPKQIDLTAIEVGAE